MKTWVEHDPTAAAAWVASVSDNPNLASTQSSLVSQWVQTDPDAAAQWVAVHVDPGTEEWDEVQRSLADSSNSEGAFEDAMLHMEQIADEKQRFYSLRSTFQFWLQDDPLAAQAAFTKLDISPEYRVKLEDEVFIGLPPSH